MRLAIFHPFLDNIGGAEVVALTLARELKADIYTTNINQERISAMGFSDITPMSIGRVPKNAPFRHQKALWLFRRLNLGTQYDAYIIAGDWAISSVVNNKPNLWYAHSPIRELWDAYPYVRTHMMAWWQRPIFDVWVLFNRYLNKKYVAHVTNVVCNSKNTQQRLEKFLGLKAGIIHPPIDTSQFYYRPHKDYWLSVNRLINHKRVAMQVEAFAQMPDKKLVIVGSYEPSRHFVAYAKHIESIKPPNVEIKNWVSHDELLELYANCTGFIATAMDEDFGMAPLEAMASGKPVIAANEGGYKETVIDGKTGMLIDDISAEKIVDAVSALSISPEAYKDACQARARKFDTTVFIDKISAIVHCFDKIR